MPAFIDIDALAAIVQLNAGPLVSVSWGTSPDRFQGFDGLDGSGNPLAGMPSIGPPANAAGSGSACRITLDIGPIVQVGVDDTRRDFDPVANAQVLTQYGLRQFTLTMRVESDTYPAAATVCERMRTRWLRKSTLAALSAINCALRKVSDTRSIDVKAWDNRAIDACVLEVFLTYRVEEIDTVGEESGNWIESVTPLTGP